MKLSKEAQETVDGCLNEARRLLRSAKALTREKNSNALVLAKALQQIASAVQALDYAEEVLKEEIPDEGGKTLVEIAAACPGNFRRFAEVVDGTLEVADYGSRVPKHSEPHRVSEPRRMCTCECGEPGCAGCACACGECFGDVVCFACGAPATGWDGRRPACNIHRVVKGESRVSPSDR